MDDGNAAGIHMNPFAVDDLDRRSGNDQHNLNAGVPVFNGIAVQRMMRYIEQNLINAVRRTEKLHESSFYFQFKTVFFLFW